MPVRAVFPEQKAYKLLSKTFEAQVLLLMFKLTSAFVGYIFFLWMVEEQLQDILHNIT